MPSYVIIGASRGIGLEYVRQLAARDNAIVVAVVRNPAGSTYLATAISGLKNVHVVAGDVTDYGTLERAAKDVAEITQGTLDYLIHNAANMDVTTVFKGFDDYADMGALDAEFLSAFKLNGLGPIHSITAFLPLLRASDTKKIIVIGTGASDATFIRRLGFANMAAYGMTKAAGHIATTKFAVKLKDEGFVVVTLSPGLVDTSSTVDDDAKDAVTRGAAAFASSAMTTTGIHIPTQTPEESVAAQLKVIDGLKPSDNGLFLAHTGGEWGRLSE